MESTKVKEEKNPSQVRNIWQINVISELCNKNLRDLASVVVRGTFILLKPLYRIQNYNNYTSPFPNKVFSTKVYNNSDLKQKEIKEEIHKATIQMNWEHKYVIVRARQNWEQCECWGLLYENIVWSKFKWLWASKFLGIQMKWLIFLGIYVSKIDSRKSWKLNAQ